MFAAVFISVRSIRAELADGDGISAGEIFSNQIFRDLLVSLASTYVLYFLASFMYREPWHMFTSFFQYLLLSPSYINVLNIYAFCNVHDISWGTKGLDGNQHVDKKDEFKGGKAGDGSSVKQNAKDRDTNYAEELKNLAGESDKKMVEKSLKEEAAERTLQESYDHAQIRCWVVLAWCSMNFALAATIMNSGGLSRLVSSDREEVQNTRSTIYMAIVLWSVALLSLVRFLGATWFLVLRLVSLRYSMRDGRFADVWTVPRCIIEDMGGGTLRDVYSRYQIMIPIAVNMTDEYGRSDSLNCRLFF